jgi:hypothetical protein
MNETGRDSSFDNKALRALKELVGTQLSAVTFVMDYIQLTFDGSRTLNANTWPTVEIRRHTFRRNEPFYRDELCARIAAKVASAQVSPDSLDISLDDDAIIRISLRVEDLDAGVSEAAELITSGCIVSFGP